MSTSLDYAYLSLFGTGNALEPAERQEADGLAATLRSGDGDHPQLHRLSELAVHWILTNPTPIPLASPGYRR